MHFVPNIWRQRCPRTGGSFCRYEVAEITADMSFLEMFDAQNEQLASNGETPVAFESGCREGTCRACCGATVIHLALLPQGEPEREHRTTRMVEQMDADLFGNCSWHGERQAACHKNISIGVITRMNRERLRALMGRSRRADGGV